MIPRQKSLSHAATSPAWPSCSGKLTLAAFLVLLTSCALTQRTDAVPDSTEIFGTSREGRPIRGVVLGPMPTLDPSDAKTETVLLFGVIHGNEPLGAPLLEELARHLERNPHLISGRRVVIVPVLNPDGLAHRTRTNSMDVDLNRNFPAESWRSGPRHGASPASEPETRALLKILRQFRPVRILAVHSPLHCVNFDGPAEDLAREMAEACNYPLRSSIGYATPGSLGSYAGEDLSIPTITLELARDAEPSTIWPRMADALARFVSADSAELGK